MPKHTIALMIKDRTARFVCCCCVVCSCNKKTVETKLVHLATMIAKTIQITCIDNVKKSWQVWFGSVVFIISISMHHLLFSTYGHKTYPTIDRLLNDCYSLVMSMKMMMMMMMMMVMMMILMQASKKMQSCHSQCFHIGGGEEKERGIKIFKV
jgi:hypothetical protein